MGSNDAINSKFSQTRHVLKFVIAKRLTKSYTHLNSCDSANDVILTCSLMSNLIHLFWGFLKFTLIFSKICPNKYFMWDYLIQTKIWQIKSKNPHLGKEIQMEILKINSTIKCQIPFNSIPRKLKY